MGRCVLQQVCSVRWPNKHSEEVQWEACKPEPVFRAESKHSKKSRDPISLSVRNGGLNVVWYCLMRVFSWLLWVRWLRWLQSRCWPRNFYDFLRLKRHKLYRIWIARVSGMCLNPECIPVVTASTSRGELKLTSKTPSLHTTKYSLFAPLNLCIF